MDRKTTSALYRQFIRIITFIDLPINRKFALFSLGVIFWLMTLAAVAVLALMKVDSSYTKIIRETVPHQQIAQKMASELATLHLETNDLCRATSSADLLGHSDLLLKRLKAIQILISGLSQDEGVSFEGDGRVRNVARLSPAAEEARAYLQTLSALADDLEKVVRQTTAEKVDLLLAGRGGEGGASQGDEMKALLQSAETLSLGYAREIDEHFHRATLEIEETIRYFFYAMVGVLFLALVLLGIFTRWISVAIAAPIRAITGQIHSLSTGDVDLSEKIAITSKDEIGTLATEFNGLMESVYGLTAFKNVIEEDVHLQDVYIRLGEVFARVAQIDSYCIYEIKDNLHEMVAVYPFNLQGDQLHCRAEILGNCELCRACKTGHTISSLVYPGVCQQFKGEDKDQQHVCVPVNVGGRIGVVVQFLASRIGNHPLDRTKIQRQVDHAITYLKEAQSVIEAKRLLTTLRDSALKDALTGLYNRRFLQEHSQKIIASCQRRETNIGLLMCDLDYFKQVNDKFGHEMGDNLLRETALALLRSVRESDYVIRFGGEEFLVLLIDVEEDEADVVAEKIRAAVAAVRVNTEDGYLSKTISVGVSVFPAEAEVFWQAIKFADVALYKAKDGGRDRAVHFRPEMWKGDSF